jgi:hypothetical protein
MSGSRSLAGRTGGKGLPWLLGGENSGRLGARNVVARTGCMAGRENPAWWT